MYDSAPFLRIFLFPLIGIAIYQIFFAKVYDLKIFKMTNFLKFQSKYIHCNLHITTTVK